MADLLTVQDIARRCRERWGRRPTDNTVRLWLRSGAITGAFLISKRVGWRASAAAVEAFIVRREEDGRAA